MAGTLKAFLLYAEEHAENSPENGTQVLRHAAPLTDVHQPQ